jgi:hypothetical protein
MGISIQAKAKARPLMKPLPTAETPRRQREQRNCGKTLIWIGLPKERSLKSCPPGIPPGRTISGEPWQPGIPGTIKYAALGGSVILLFNTSSVWEIQSRQTAKARPLMKPLPTAEQPRRQREEGNCSEKPRYALEVHLSRVRNAQAGRTK